MDGGVSAQNEWDNPYDNYDDKPLPDESEGACTCPDPSCSVHGTPVEAQTTTEVTSQGTALNVPVTMQLENLGPDKAPPFDAQDAEQARKKKNSQPMQQPVGVPEMMPATAKRRAQATPEPKSLNEEPKVEGQPDDAVKVEAVLKHVVNGKRVQANGYSLEADFDKDQIVLTTPSGATRFAPVYAMRRVALDFVRVAQKSPNFEPKVNAQQPSKVKLPGSGGGGVLGDDSGSDPKLDGEFNASGIGKRPKNQATPSNPGPDSQSDGLQHFDVANRGPHNSVPKGKMSDEDIWGDTEQEGLQPFDIKINEPQSK